MNSLIKRYKNLSVAVKASLWFTLANFLQSGISFITAPIFTRVLSTNEYGAVSTFGAWNTVLVLLLSLSLHKSLMNLYVKHQRKGKVLSAIISLSLLVTIFWFVLFLLFHEVISQILGISMLLTVSLFINVIFISSINCWYIYKRYTYDYKSLIIYTILTTVLSTIVSLVVVIGYSKTAEARVVPGVAITAIAGIIIIISILKKEKRFYDKEVWVFSIGFSTALLPHYLSEFVLSSSDKLMINNMMGSSAVAIYSVAYTIGSLITLVTTAINASFAPYQYQKIATKEFKKLAKVANQVLLFIALLLMVVMLFSKEIVLIFGGSKYQDSASLVIPICLGVFFNYMFQLFARVQEYYERKKTVVIPSVLCAILNLILNYIFIPIYGYQAAAYTTFICYLIFCVVHYLFYRTVCKEILSGEKIYNIKGLLVISSVVIVGAFVIDFLNQFLIVKNILLAVAAIAILIKRDKITILLKEMSNRA